MEKIDDPVKIRTILVSVSDKTGLETFIPGLVNINPDLMILSTGGTYERIKQILGSDSDKCLTRVSEYTGQPETQGGLVKTLDFKIYLGLLTETYNDAHQKDLERTNAKPIDMVVVNLYPFTDTIAEKDSTLEQARANIDIGGPTMIRAAAKNFLRVASVVDPSSYASILCSLKDGNGFLTLKDRFRLAKKASEHTAAYDRAIADYLADVPDDELEPCYKSGE